MLADLTRSVDAAIISLVDLRTAMPEPQYVLDTSEFDRHVGTYPDLWRAGGMIITPVAGELHIGMPTLTQYGCDVEPLFSPLSSDIFYVTTDNNSYDLTFNPLTPGGPSQCARNRVFVVNRVPGPPPRPRPARRHPVTGWHAG